MGGYKYREQNLLEFNLPYNKKRGRAKLIWKVQKHDYKSTISYKQF